MSQGGSRELLWVLVCRPRMILVAVAFDFGRVFVVVFEHFVFGAFSNFSGCSWKVFGAFSLPCTLLRSREGPGRFQGGFSGSPSEAPRRSGVCSAVF